ncbi:hypothetical protein RvY_14616 [Ramazzottius varieornatus]|uniref:RNA helicase n=1 Tax=Ramazzottius varieornatus TaxID=947166 RepID=A0A1D1VRY6_RAMVA|nr:hypothetical protein RvY_14616 [Ramazzottius varieornatus]
MESAETKNQRRKQRKKLRREQKPDVEAMDTTLSKDDVKMNVDGDSSSLVPDHDMEVEMQEPKVLLTEVGTGFTVIGQAKQSKKVKLPPYLPAWYSAPQPLSSDVAEAGLPVEDMPGLDLRFVTALHDQGITSFFPVQRTIIPNILSYQNNLRYYAGRPSDMCICAPTGSGKTLAYVIPILQDLSKRSSSKIRALILLPVKELAVQVADVFQTFAKGTRVKIALICGKQALDQERQQILQLDEFETQLKESSWMSSERNWTHTRKTPVDVLIATPGRLVDHLYETTDLDLQSLEYLVVDEADRMIEEFKNNWFRLLERAVFKNPEVRPALDYTCINHYTKPTLPLQKLLFSATLSYDPQRFEVLKLYRPKLFAAVALENNGDMMMRNDAEVIGAYATPKGLKEFSIQIDPRLKPLVILHLLNVMKWRKVLIFTNSLENTKRLTLLIKMFSEGTNSLIVHEVSSNVHQRKRQASLDSFEKGTVDVIVASDSVARGIDLPNVEYVVLYDAPLHTKTYIHRVGRTARAGKSGTALTLLKADEKKGYTKIMKELNKQPPPKFVVAPEELVALEGPYKVALQKLEKEMNHS